MSKKRKTKKKKTTNKSNEKIASATNSKTPKTTSPKQNITSSSNNKFIGWFFAFLAAALYFNTLGHQYAFDDSIVITANSFTLEGFAGIGDLMTRDFFEGIYGEKGMDLQGGRYRPLSLVLFAIEEQLFPGNPFIGHFMNLVFYALTGILLFRVLTNWLDKTEGGTVIAFITSLLFVCHPIHTEVVANIKSRDELLAFLLILVSLHGLYKFMKEKNRKWMFIALISFFLSMMSKENAFTYILLIPLSLFVLQKITLAKAFKYSIPFFAVGIFYVALRSYMLYKEPVAGALVPLENPDIMENPFVGADFSIRFATIGVILLHYIMLLVYPHPMSSDYSFNQIPWVSFDDPSALIGWAFYIAIGIYAAIRIWKKDIIALSIVLYLAPLSLVVNILFNIGAPMADRFLYAPSFGFCLAIAFLLVKFSKVHNFEQLKKNIPMAVGLLIISILFCGKTIARNPDWYNNEALFSKDVKAAPNSAKIHYYYANTLLKKFLDKNTQNSHSPSAEDLVLLDSSEAHFLRSYNINPKFHHATYNLGLINIHKKKPREALKWLEYTLTLQPHHGVSHEQLVRVYGELLNQPDKALEHLKIVLSTVEGQKNASNYQHYGIIMAMKGNITESENAFLKAANMAPGMAKSCYQNLAGMFGNMASVAQNNGETEKALTYSKKAQYYNQLANNSN